MQNDAARHILTKTRLRDGLAWLGHPRILFYALPCLMALLTAGTLAQRDIGLYAAQKTFFASWLIWLGPVPLPGAYPILGLIFVSLAVKFLVFSPWRREQAGIILTHMGILLLLTGSLITALTSREGFVVIPEGGTSAVISSYHDRVLAVETDGQPVAAWTLASLSPGMPLTVPDLPFRLTVLKTCRHCTARIPPETGDRRDLAAKMDLIPAPEEKDEELNLSGVTFALSGAQGDRNGTYITLEDVPVRPVVEHAGKNYTIYVRRAQTILPFSLRLEDFVQDLHPGTAMARGYHSDIVVEDGQIEWPARIAMNQPLRYKGYTFYQSSFSQTADGTQKTVLSAVRNSGRSFPYIASAVIFAGLLLHLAIRMKGRRP